MNALRQTRKHTTGSRAFLGGGLIVDMPINARSTHDNNSISSLTDGQFVEVKRRVQILLPKSLEAHLDRLQRKIGKNSNAAIIRIALGFIYNLIDLVDHSASIFIEGANGRRPLPPMILMGALSPDLSTKETVKYQIMLSPENDDKLASMITKLEATSAAEVVRYSVRVLDALIEIMREDECIIIEKNNEDIELNIA